MRPYTGAASAAGAGPDLQDERIILGGFFSVILHPAVNSIAVDTVEICKSVVPVMQEVEPGHMVACHLYNPKPEINEKPTQAI